MQLLSGTLRCLQVLRRTKLSVDFVVPSNAAAGRCLNRRHYANVPPIAMSSEQFEGPTPDASRSPLITLHGLFGSKQNWRSVSRALARHTNRRIYAADLRNHGDSPHADTHNSHGMTADIYAFLQSNSIERTSLMGHSMGGRAVMHFALTYPQLVDRLIVVDISPVSIPKTINYMKELLGSMLSLSLPPEMSLSEGRQQTRRQLIETVGPETVDFILLNLRKRPETGEFYWACNVQVLYDSLTGFLGYSANINVLEPFTAPTTFICGNQSSYMNPDDWPAILEFFPNATIHWLDAGHLVHLEKPHEFIAIATDFLNS
ncbi:hypothetical protein KR222_009524 [Zaprionus bogoriensis]|nr:hypothetical protein KR222_009524 [Zaprionus bogoriensis]